MGFPPTSYSYILFLVVLLPALCHSQESQQQAQGRYERYERSRATYYGTPDNLGTPTGACGYGGYGRTINDGSVTGVSRLFRDGTGCGACYQVRCKVPQLCAQNGVNVMVTDQGSGDRTDFILSPRAYRGMARQNYASELLAYGTVDVEYRRVPCQYPGKNLMVKVHEHSRFPDYLAIVFLYQAGQYDIIAVEMFQEDKQQWRGMRKSYGAVWDASNPPRGSLNIRFLVSGSSGQTWMELNSVISSEWKAGAVFDTYMQLK